MKKLNKKSCIIVLVIMIILVIIGIIVFKLMEPKTTNDEEAMVESTEEKPGILSNILSSFGGEDEDEVKTDDELEYTTSSDGGTTYDVNGNEVGWTDSDEARYLREFEEALATEQAEADYEVQPYMYPGEYQTYTEVVPEDEEPGVDLSEYDWRYVKIGEVMTVDGTKCDMIPSGIYLCKSDTVGGTPLGDNFPKLDLSQPITGLCIGGYSIPDGVYKVVSGTVDYSFSREALVSSNGYVYKKWCGYVFSDMPGEDGTIHIATGTPYHFTGCKLEKVGE